MRKRLIEKFTKAKEGSFGYTMTELLVVVAIIAIVAAIAIPSVIAISRALKFKRVNDHAKSIFLAAQQNLTEMRSDGGLKPLQKAGEEGGVYQITSASFPAEFKTEYVYTTTGTDAFELILPAGSVEATVRAEDIVIEYNPITGNVYAVFYCEDDDQNIMSAYADTDTDLPREDKAARKNMMLGYYDGSGLNSSQLELEKTQASVEFVNGEEGIVRVLVPVPDDFFSSVDKYAQALEINLTVTGEYSMVKAAENPPAEGQAAPVISFSLPIKDSTTGLGPNCYVENGNTVVVEYPIDSLVNMGSFANYASGTQKGAKNASGGSAEAALTEQMDETGFSVLPGENITIQADVIVDTAVSEVQVKVDSGILSGVNPMFEYLQPSGSGGYVLAVSNGRNLQNLNAIAPTIAKQVDSVVFTSDIYWNDTVSYYNDTYGNGSGTYTNAAAENPARALPYFVPIHNEGLFGTAKFIFPTDESDGGLGGILGDLLGDILGNIFGGYTNPNVPTLTDEMDTVTGASHATIQGNEHKVFNLNVDSTKYTVPNMGEKGTIKNPETGAVTETDLTGKFYAVGANQTIDYCFTGLFGYVNTPIDNLHVVNPIIKGHELTKEDTIVPNYINTIFGPIQWGTKTVSAYNNPATGALLGAGGFNTLITDCSTYIDKNAEGYVATYLGHGNYSINGAQNWYGVSGEGAVGGLVGYAKSHRNVTGELTNDKAVLAFADCFAAVPVTGNMRGTDDKHFGYSNGVGAFIGNSQLTNFYNCYASGDVKASGCYVSRTLAGSLGSIVENLFGVELDLLYNGRYSMGAGGFVGTSHGTRYTNCFATGDVTASAATSKGAGGFVGFMSIDETFTYGNLNNQGKEEVAQRTVFTNCYSVGTAVTNSSTYENFSGGNGRIAFSINQTLTYIVGDYYRLYAPYYYRTQGGTPQYGDSTYIYRDTYFLNYGRVTSGNQDSSSTCADPESYDILRNLPAAHTRGSSWSEGKLEAIKNISIIFDGGPNYGSVYFRRYPALNDIYRRLLSEGYSSEEWGPATATTTHPYTVSSSGAVYPFSKLVGLEYYGDWPSKPSEIGMAYYEQYVDDLETDGSYKTYYLFDKERGDTDTRLALRDGENVRVYKDGYAIFSASPSNLVVTIGNKSATLASSGAFFNIEGKKYYSFLLSDDLMEVLPANGEFYIQVSAKHSDSNDTYTMYFNPNAAMSHANPANGSKDAEKPDAAPKTIYVRSARQFKALATLDDFWGNAYSYIQQLNIDATKYDDWGTAANVAKRQVGSIGETTKPFHASYSAGYTTVGDVAKQYKLTGFQPVDNGFFGVIGNNGSVENLIVECGAVTVGDDTRSDVAVLAGRNQGTISNVDMTLSDAVTLTSQDNAGLLVGYSSGTIRNCEVNAAAVTVNAKHGGGLIGSAVGTANAKATVSGCKLTLTGNLSVNGADNAGGLIGHASHLNLSATEPLVTLTNMTADADYAGGLAGYLENTEIKITDSANAVTVTLTSVRNDKGYAAGVLGGGKSVTINSVDVNAGTIEGKAAAGFLGTGTDIDATYCDVVITNKIKGAEKAAGVAGTIGAQSVFGYVPVTLNNVTVSASNGNAAGYAVEIAKEANVMNANVTLGGTAKIQASGNAAGYACTVAGYVGNTTGSTMLSSVVGKGTVSGANAAGFACDITGQVAGAFVTPALTATKEAYQGNSNNNLTVNGTTSAAGFALSVGTDATVTNCYALNKISGGAVTGFVQNNKGTINGCMANVTISGGYAFVEKNEGTVSRCYGWYGDGDETNATTTKAEVGGKCFSAYFADLNPVDKEGDIVTLYAADGTMQNITATELQGAADVLANTNNKWYTTGYNSYPYTNKPTAMPNYLYPMLRDHFGDWVTPPQYAYGVAYYETYEVTAPAAEAAEEGVEEAAETAKPATSTVVKLHMVDLSDSAITEEKQAVTTYLIDNAGNVTTSATTVFNNDYTIKTSGYAVFGKKGANVLASISGETALFSCELTTNNKRITYEFFPLKTDSAKDGVVSIGATAVSSTGATVQTWFADAINPGNTYEVRTPEQLAKIGAVAANFSQTHDIAVTDFTTVAKLSGNYAGNGLKLSVSGQTKTWLREVAGKLENLNLVVSGGVNKPVFGAVSGTVTLSGLTVDTIGAEGALAETVSGTVNIPAVQTAAVSGKLFGEVTGTVTTKAIQVTGDVNQLFGGVKNVTVDGAITVGGNATKLFGNVTGTVGTKAISVTGAATQVFGNVSANAEKNNKVTVDGAINVTGAATQVFGTVGAPVEVKGTITTGAVNTQVFGAVNANVTTGAVTVNGTAAQVFGEVGNGTVTVNGDISVDKTTAHTGKIFNDVKNTVNVTGKISLGEIGGNGQVFGAVTAPVTVSGGITSSNGTAEAPAYGAVNGQIFGAITLDATETVNIGGITVGNIASGKSLITSISGGTVSTGAVTVKNVSGQVFGPISGGTVTVGAVSTQAVGSSVTEGEGESAKTTVTNANIFGDVSANTDKTNSVTVASITTNGKDVYGNVFGNIGAPVTVTNGITTGNLTGKVFGNVSADVTTESITAGAVTGDIFGDITGGTVTTGAIQVASLSGKLAGTVGGTLQGNASEAKSISLGSNVTLGNLVTKVGSNGVLKNYSLSSITHMSAPLVGGELGGTLDNVDVTAGSATVESGVLVNSVASGATVKNCAVTITGKVEATGTTVGGLTGTNAGTLTDNNVTINALNITGKDGVRTVIGGIAAVNNGTVTNGTLTGGIITGGSATMNVTYTQTASDQVGIGGLVGWMKGGSLANATANGSINLGGTGATGNGRNNYFVGGAVAFDGEVDKTHKSTYTGVTSNVTIGSNWAGAKLEVANYQFQNLSGSVGMFVGVVTDGSFNTCASNVKDNAAYQFLGQVAVSTATLPELDPEKDQGWFSHDSGEDKSFEVKAGTNLVDFAAENDYYEVSEGTYITCNAKLNACTFYLSNVQYTQKLEPTEYFHLGEKVTEEGGWAQTPAKTSTDWDKGSSLTYNDLYSGNSSVPNHETDYYYKDSEGNYQPVTVKVKKNGNKYSYWVYAGGREIAKRSDIKANDRDESNVKKDNKNLTFYKPVSTVPQGEDKYLITDIGNNHYFDGTTTGVAIEENDKGYVSNSNLALWTVDSDGYWSYNGNYLKLGNGDSGLVGPSNEKNKFYVEEADNGFVLYRNQINGNGKYYLRYSEGTFFRRDSQQTIMIWTLTEVPNEYSCVFDYSTNKLHSVVCVGVDADGNVLPAATALSEEIENPADNGGETGNNT